jgi:hypothetical protein
VLRKIIIQEKTDCGRSIRTFQLFDRKFKDTDRLVKPLPDNNDRSQRES